MAKGGADESGEKAAAAAAAVVEELPKSIVRRVVKEKLSQLSSSSSSRQKSKAKSNGDGVEGEDVMVHKDALLALGEGARIFIHYLSATSNDICKESKRTTINVEDVLKALEEFEFPEFIEPLRVSLKEFRRKNVAKKSGANSKAEETEKKRKMDKEEPTQDGGKVVKMLPREKRRKNSVLCCVV